MGEREGRHTAEDAAGYYTCPTACVETNHPGREHCCGTCVGGVLAKRDRERDRRVAAEGAEKAWSDGYNDAVTMARCYGHADHWPEEDEPRNPYAQGRAAAGEGESRVEHHADDCAKAADFAARCTCEETP